MRWGEVAIAVIAIGAVGAGVYSWTHREPVFADAAQKEITKQEPERKQCEARLKELFDAVAAYRKDHKGSDPTSIGQLLPKYVKDPEMLVCPTAKRWMDAKVNMQKGSVSVDGKSHDVTYGFQWLTSGAVRAKKLLGDKAPLIICRSHSEAIYMVAYKRVQPVGIYTSDKKDSLIPEVKNAKDIVVRMNGQVGDIDPAEE